VLGFEREGREASNRNGLCDLCVSVLLNPPFPLSSHLHQHNITDGRFSCFAYTTASTGTLRFRIQHNGNSHHHDTQVTNNIPQINCMCHHPPPASRSEWSPPSTNAGTRPLSFPTHHTNNHPMCRSPAVTASHTPKIHRVTPPPPTEGVQLGNASSVSQTGVASKLSYWPGPDLKVPAPAPPSKQHPDFETPPPVLDVRAQPQAHITHKTRDGRTPRRSIFCVKNHASV